MIQKDCENLIYIEYDESMGSKTLNRYMKGTEHCSEYSYYEGNIIERNSEYYNDQSKFSFRLNFPEKKSSIKMISESESLSFSEEELNNKSFFSFSNREEEKNISNQEINKNKEINNERKKASASPKKEQNSKKLLKNKHFILKINKIINKLKKKKIIYDILNKKEKINNLKDKPFNHLKENKNISREELKDLSKYELGAFIKTIINKYKLNNLLSLSYNYKINEICFINKKLKKKLYFFASTNLKENNNIINYKEVNDSTIIYKLGINFDIAYNLSKINNYLNEEFLKYMFYLMIFGYKLLEVLKWKYNRLKKFFLLKEKKRNIIIIYSFIKIS